MSRNAINKTRFIGALREEIRSDGPIYLLCSAFALYGLFDAAVKGYSLTGMLDAYAYKWTVNFLFIGPLFALIVTVIGISLRLRARKHLAYRLIVAPRHMSRFAAGTLLLLTAGLLFTSVFSALKTSFSSTHGFAHDRLHADIDKVLHFGQDPFHYLYAFAKHDWVLRLLEFNYGILWFVVCYFSLYFVVTSTRANAIRLRFALTWFGSWVVVGAALAGNFLSAGPVYYGRVTGDFARFGEQVNFLATSSDFGGSAHNLQEYLWRLYETGQVGMGSGISAFPSMHVALATVVALYAWEWSRVWGGVAWVYTAVIVLSSVYLGWHYAIDGYVSIAVVAGLYWALRAVLPNVSRLRWGLASPAVPGAVVAQIEKRA